MHNWAPSHSKFRLFRKTTNKLFLDSYTATHVKQKNLNVQGDGLDGGGGAEPVEGCGGKKHKRLIYFRPGNPSWTHNVGAATCVFTCHHDTSGTDEPERKIDRGNQWRFS